MIAELVSITPRVVTDAGYDSVFEEEYWNDVFDEGADFLDHRRIWAGVMAEFVYIRPHPSEQRHRPTTYRVAGQTRSATATVGTARQFF